MQKKDFTLRRARPNSRQRSFMLQVVPKAFSFFAKLVAKEVWSANHSKASLTQIYQWRCVVKCEDLKKEKKNNSLLHPTHLGSLRWLFPCRRNAEPSGPGFSGRSRGIRWRMRWGTRRTRCRRWWSVPMTWQYVPAQFPCPCCTGTWRSSPARPWLLRSSTANDEFGNEEVPDSRFSSNRLCRWLNSVFTRSSTSHVFVFFYFLFFCALPGGESSSVRRETETDVSAKRPLSYWVVKCNWEKVEMKWENIWEWSEGKKNVFSRWYPGNTDEWNRMLVEISYVFYIHTQCVMSIFLGLTLRKIIYEKAKKFFLRNFL